MTQYLQLPETILSKDEIAAEESKDVELDDSRTETVINFDEEAGEQDVDQAQMGEDEKEGNVDNVSDKIDDHLDTPIDINTICTNSNSK